MYACMYACMYEYDHVCNQSTPDLLHEHLCIGPQVPRRKADDLLQQRTAQWVGGWMYEREGWDEDREVEVA